MERTELTNQIITSPEAEKILDFVSPIYGNSYVGLWLFEVIGRELDDMYHWAVGFEDQTVPDRATWSLPYFEQEYGIIPDPNDSIEARRAAIIQKMRYRGPMNPAKLENVVEVAAGVEADILENTGKNRFTIILRDLPKNLMKGSTKSIAALQRAVEDAKPAHLIYDVCIEKQIDVNPVVRTAVSMSQNKRYNVEIQNNMKFITLPEMRTYIATATSQHRKNYISVT